MSDIAIVRINPVENEAVPKSASAIATAPPRSYSGIRSRSSWSGSART
jgi:hypothetical protein